jgi:hypothetical protein
MPQQAKQDAPEMISLREFLETVPPGQQKLIRDLGRDPFYPANRPNGAYFGAPDIELFCGTEGTCEKMQMFQCVDKTDISLAVNGTEERFVYYLCRNCGNSQKVFAIFWHLSADYKTGTIYKYGEVPQFGPPTPPRLTTLIRDCKELFFKGRRAENQGMGIAAFAYYRRVIDNQRERIFDQIIKVCVTLSVDPEIINELEAAKKETQFAKAIDSVKHALPQALLINGQNPLALLYAALSDGLHGRTDEECLELATDIRIVMAEFADRMAQAMKDEAELTTSVNRLLKRKAAVGQPPAATASASESASQTSK